MFSDELVLFISSMKRQLFLCVSFPLPLPSFSVIEKRLRLCSTYLGKKNIFANPDFSDVKFSADFRTVKIFALRRREDRPKPAEIGRHSKNRYLTPESNSSPHFTMGKQFLQF